MKPDIHLHTEPGMDIFISEEQVIEMRTRSLLSRFLKSYREYRRCGLGIWRSIDSAWFLARL